MPKDAPPKTPLNPREKLGQYYNLEEEIPDFIKDKLFTSQTSLHSIAASSSGDIGAIKKFFEDDRISLLDREAIATQMLTGNHTFPNTRSATSHGPSSSRRIHLSRDEETIKRLNRHKMPKPTFLTLNTTSSSIPEMNPKTVHLNKIETIRKAPSNIKPIVSKSTKSTAIFRMDPMHEKTIPYKNAQTAEAKRYTSVPLS